MRMVSILMISAALVTLNACGQATKKGEAAKSDGVITVSADKDFALSLQTALIEAKPGNLILMPAGTFDLIDGLSLDVDGVTLKGAGEGKTILNFKGQTGAGEGLLVTSDDVVLEHFTVQDTKGDGIKSKGADRIIYRDLTVEWTRGPHSENGAYAIYPVESTDVLVDRVTVRASSDAGIYVGQSNNIIVRNSLAEFNVAGIEIENSTRADVYNNRAINNTGGILIFDLPDLPIMGGHSTRIFNNIVTDNNTENFAPPGGIVGEVMSGSGLIVLANENVHIFNNRFENNRTAHVTVAAYTRDTDDQNYNALPRNVVIRDNTYVGGGDDPQGLMSLVAPLIGGTIPPIVWDGASAYRDSEPVDINLTIAEADTVGFLNLGAGRAPLNIAAANPSMERPTGTPKPEPTAVMLPQDQTP